MGEMATVTHYLSHNPPTSPPEPFWGSKENRKRGFSFLWLLRFIGRGSLFPRATGPPSTNALQPEVVAMPRAREEYGGGQHRRGPRGRRNVVTPKPAYWPGGRMAASRYILSLCAWSRVAARQGPAGRMPVG